MIQKDQKRLQQRGSISNLDPCLDGNGLLSVRERIKRLSINDECKHPIILSKRVRVSKLIISWFHRESYDIKQDLKIWLLHL